MAAPAAVDTDGPREDNLIRENDSVIVTGGDVHRVIVVKKGARVKLARNADVNITSLIGQPFGRCYEVEDGTKALVLSTDLPDLGETSAEASQMDAAKDNRNLVAGNDNQRLTQDEIQRMRDEAGTKGIVDKLVEHSATFEDKTAFSQEKYIRKKKKKYAALFMVERLMVDNVCEMHCPTRRSDTFDDNRCLRLRVDTVAQLMCLANVHHQSRVLITEKTNGFLSAAVLDRLGENGRLINVMPPKGQPTMQMARNMLLPYVKRRWTCVPYKGLLDGHEEPAKARVDDDGNPLPPSTRTTQWLSGKAAKEMLTADPADSLLIAEDDQETLLEMAQSLLPFLGLSGQLVVYCPYLEPLCELFRQLRNSEVINIVIRDSWMREYQILPCRTHPLVNMSHAGGYFLSAIRIGTAADAAPAVAAAQAAASVVSEEAPLKKQRLEE